VTSSSQSGVCGTSQDTGLLRSVSRIHNRTNYFCGRIFTPLLLQVQLSHGAGHKETGPWEVDIDHITAKCDDLESILIVAKVTGGVTNQSLLVTYHRNI
jgi:hypothetical protein